MKLLEGKVALVTGASKGIGAGIAKGLASEGASVIVNYVSSKAAADALVASIKAEGGNAVAVMGDVSKAQQAQGLIDAAIEHFSKLDILVNNSGIYEFAPLEQVTEEVYRKTFDINVLGLLLTTQAAAARMASGSSIINIGSSASTLLSPGTAVYTASKSAVDAITSVLAKELGSRGIRVNSINPGFTVTEGTAAFVGGEFAAGLVQRTSLGRAGQPSDIAAVAVFLASERSGWVTGERISASGGIY